MEFVATCPQGFEQLLANELRQLRCQQIRPLKGQVSFAGEQREALRACLWSRLASRIICLLDRVGASDSDSLYEGISAIAWEEHITSGTTFVVNAHGTNEKLRDSRFVALRAKDAIVDRIVRRTGIRPQVDTKHPDLSLSVRISGNRASVGIDLSGEPLFRRGYESRASRRAPIAPLRADYAAALLALGNWHPQDERELVLPFVGAGTLAAEAAGMFLGWPAGIARTRWGFSGWAALESTTWDGLEQEARERCEQHDVPAPRIHACDLRRGSDTVVRHLLRAGGYTIDLPDFSPANVAESLRKPALLACDLSWIAPEDVPLQASALSIISQVVARIPEGSSATALAAGGVVDESVGAPAEQVRDVIVGREQQSLRAYPVLAATHHPSVSLADGETVGLLVSQSEQFAARLAKVYKQRRKWARREDVSCYRVYDADLPDYATTIDLFEGSGGKGRWLQLSEYAPPQSVDADLARKRLLDVVALAPKILDVRPEDTHVRVRTRSRGGSQYADEQRETKERTRTRKGEVPLPPGAHLVDEGGLVFEVNFNLRHDCGLFLDHRETRALLREMAKQTKGSKRFLNLFAYTGTASCYAADGGARFTTTVDLSKPSLNWARRNMERNGFVGRQHEFVQADVVRWVSEQRRTRNRWDLIFCDVPTFSNSKRMRTASFDVQRDHSELLIGVSRLLTRDGTCVFSCNLRNFKPDEAALAKAGVSIEDITAQTIPEDFARNPKIHHCYLVRRTPRTGPQNPSERRQAR